MNTTVRIIAQKRVRFLTQAQLRGTVETYRTLGQDVAIEEQEKLIRTTEQRKCEKNNLEQELKRIKQDTAEATKDMYRIMGHMTELRQMWVADQTSCH